MISFIGNLGFGVYYYKDVFMVLLWYRICVIIVVGCGDGNNILENV